MFVRQVVGISVLAGAGDDAAGRQKSATLEALAERLNADPAKLSASWEAYNAAARGEREDAFGKSPDMRQRLGAGPFYALDISIGAPTFPAGDLTTGRPDDR